MKSTVKTRVEFIYADSELFSWVEWYPQSQALKQHWGMCFYDLTLARLIFYVDDDDEKSEGEYFAKDRNYLNHRKIRDWAFVKSGGKLPMIILIRNILLRPDIRLELNGDGRRIRELCQDGIFQLSDE